MSSNSVASVVDRKTGEKVAQFTTNTTNPAAFTQYVIGMCHFFSGPKGPAYLVWEENGPGNEFTSEVKQSSFRNIFYREDEKRMGRKKTLKAGWWSNKETKRILLKDYLKALQNGKFINRCEEAIDECGQYVHNPDGTVEHARSRDTIDPTASGENHGDMVIADALAWRGFQDEPRTQDERTPDVPIGSFLWRRNEARLQREQETRW